MAILLISLFLLVISLFTPFGPKTLAYLADSSIKELTVKGVNGSILSGLKIDEFSWQSDTTVNLKDINLNVKKYDIDKKKLVTDKLSVGQLAIVIPESSETATTDSVSLPNFSIPLNINASNVNLDSLQIIQNIPDDEQSLSLLFQINKIQLKDVVIEDGFLNFQNLTGNPIILDEPLEINVSNGRMDMNHPHSIKTSGNVSYKHPELGKLVGDIDLDGTLTEYEFESDILLDQQLIGQESIKLSGKGDYKSVDFESVSIDGEHGKANAVGNVAWDPEIKWQFDIEGIELNSNKIYPDLKLKADTKLKYTGTYLDSRLENQVEIASFEGKIKDYKVSANGLITERQGLIRTENLNINVGDNQLDVTGAITEPMSLAVNIKAPNIKQLYPDASGNIQGTAKISGTYKEPEIQTKLTVKQLSYAGFVQTKESIKVDADLGLVSDQLMLKKLDVKSGNNAISANGKATEPFNIKWNIKADNLAQLHSDIKGNVIGKGELKGTIKEPVIKVNIKGNKLAYKDFNQGDFPLDLQGEIATKKKIILLKNLLAKSGNNSVLINGTANEPLNLQLHVKAENLKQVSPDLSGQVFGNTQVLGKYKSPIIKTKLTARNLRFQETQLSQSEMRLNGEVQLVEGVPIIKSMDSQIGENIFRVTGKASSPFDLKWNINGKNLKQISSEVSGRLTANGQLQGTIEKPIINAKINANQFNYKNIRVGKGDFTASTNNGVYDIKGTLSKFKSDDQEIDSAKFDLKGRIENHTLTADVKHKEGRVAVKANGAWINPNWNGRIQSLKLKETKAGDWTMQKPTRVSISKNGFKADKFCLNNKKTTTCSQASWNEKTGLVAKGTLNKTPLSLIKPMLPDNIDLNGTVNGSYDIQQNNGKPKGTIRFKLPKDSFSIKGDDGETRMFVYEDAEITAKVNNRTVDAETSMKIVNRGTFRSKAKIKLSPENGKHTIDGSAQFDVPNINFAQELIPRSRGLRGALSSKITFSGLLSKPQIKGEANIKNAYLRLPEAGTELTNININLKANKPGKAIIKGKMFMGRGVLNMTGELNVQDIAKWSANVKVTGQNIRFMNTNEIKATMSPDLLINVSPQLVKLSGKVAIPFADIRLKDIPETSIDESNDTFVIGERKPGEQVSAIRVQPNVKIQLGDKVKLDAFGLNAKLAGDVNVTHNRRDILANGSLRVSDGKFQAYGQDLQINNGRLIFNGSPKLVGMDIRATRKIEDQIVGVHLGGTLLSPKSKIFSDPTLPESEALSFLLTGHSLSTSSGQESALLMSAVRGLGISGSGSLVQKIGTSFGLDDVNIVTKEDLKKSELALGKRLGSRLYVRYLVGLFDQTQKIAIEYKINKVLSLEAQTTAEDYGLDFIYEIERD